jgi:hypothetical protein
MQFKPELKRVSDRYRQILTNKNLDPALLDELLNELQQPLAEHQIALLINEAIQHYALENKKSSFFRGPHLFKSSTGHEFVGIDVSILSSIEDVHIQYLQADIAAKCFNQGPSHEADRETPFVQVVGDEQLFSANGTEYARSTLKTLLTERFPESVLLYGFVGNSDPKLKTGNTNHLINELIATKEIDSNRVLANTLHGHTQRAMQEATQLSIAKEVKWFTLVYQYDSKNGKVVDCSEWEDAPFLARLTNQAVICCEGDIQCLHYLIQMLNKNVRVIGITGIRETRKDSEKSYFSAIGFLNYMNHTVQKLPINNKTIDSVDLQGELKRYAESFLSDDTFENQQLFLECIETIVEQQLWNKQDLITIKIMPENQKSNPILSLNMDYLARSGSPIVGTQQQGESCSDPDTYTPQEQYVAP